jgi:hypothetical protein
MAQKYRKKPVVIEAVRWSGSNWHELLAWIDWEGGQKIRTMERDDEMLLIIPTLEGAMEASPGDWVIKGVKNEFYPCKPEIFEATYEPVEE